MSAGQGERREGSEWWRKKRRSGIDDYLSAGYHRLLLQLLSTPGFQLPSEQRLRTNGIALEAPNWRPQNLAHVMRVVLNRDGNLLYCGLTLHVAPRGRNCLWLRLRILIVCYFLRRVGLWNACWAFDIPRCATHPKSSWRGNWLLQLAAVSRLLWLANSRGCRFGITRIPRTRVVSLLRCRWLRLRLRILFGGRALGVCW